MQNTLLQLYCCQSVGVLHVLGWSTCQSCVTGVDDQAELL